MVLSKYMFWFHIRVIYISVASKPLCKTFTFQVAALQKTLDDSVPAYELENTNKHFTELTERYRDLLEKSNTLVARTEESSGYEVSLGKHNSLVPEIYPQHRWGSETLDFATEEGCS